MSEKRQGLNFKYMICNLYIQRNQCLKCLVIQQSHGATEHLCVGGEFIQLCQEILSKKIKTLNPKKVKQIQDSIGNSCCNLWIQIEVIVKCTGKAT